MRIQFYISGERLCGSSHLQMQMQKGMQISTLEKFYWQTQIYAKSFGFLPAVVGMLDEVQQQLSFKYSRDPNYGFEGLNHARSKNASFTQYWI